MVTSLGSQNRAPAPHQVLWEHTVNWGCKLRGWVPKQVRFRTLPTLPVQMWGWGAQKTMHNSSYFDSRVMEILIGKFS